MRIKQFRQLLPTTPCTILFLSITTGEAIVDICIVAILLHSVADGFINSVLAKNEDSVMPVYLGLFVLAHVFQFVLAVDALAAQNTLQIVGLVIFNTAFLVYGIIQIKEIEPLITGKVLSILVWFIPGMIAFTELVYLSTLWPIYRQFGWSIYKRIGADRGHKRYFKWYQVFVCILKFDVFFFLSFSLQLVLLVFNQNDVERWLTVAALPVTILLLFIGYFSVRQEKKYLYWIFFAGTIVGAGYFVFKLFRIYQYRATDYKLVYKSLTVFAALCFAALIWTGTTSIICYRHFGRGLKAQMQRVQDDGDDSKEEIYGNHEMLESRMTLE